MNAQASKVTTLEDPIESPVVADKAKGKVKASGSDSALSGKKVAVTFYEQEGDLGKAPVFAGLNGVGYNIPRGVPCDIPEELMEVFEHAKYKLVETSLGGGSKERDVNRFAYSVAR